jgi:hypothetical protein
MALPFSANGRRKRNGRASIRFLSDFDACSLFNLSNHPSGLIQFLRAGEKWIYVIAWDTEQQPTTRLRIEKQHLFCLAQRGDEPHI